MLGFVYKEWFTDQFETFINKTVVDYREDPDLQNIVDFTQGYVCLFHHIPNYKDKIIFI